MRKAWNVMTTVLVAVIILLAVLLVGVRLVGLDVYTVLSGSMEPTYHTGSVIYVKSIDPEDVEVGMPITFVLDENLTVATHRVIEIDEENQHFYTQGDANEYPDGSPVHFNNLVGTPVFTIPYLGYVANYIQNPPGTYIAIAAVVIILMMVFVPDLFDEEKKAARAEKKAKKSGKSSLIKADEADAANPEEG